jgi:hypothetical protein
MTTRQEILAEIQTTLENIVNSNGDRVFKFVGDTRSPINLETVPLPSVFFYSGRETRITDGIEAVIGKENWEWVITLEVWAQDNDMEILLEYIHEAMYANYRLGNHAEWSERMGVDFFTIDPAQQLQAMIIAYRAIYRHDLGNM